MRRTLPLEDATRKPWPPAYAAGIKHPDPEPTPYEAGPPTRAADPTRQSGRMMRPRLGWWMLLVDAAGGACAGCAPSDAHGPTPTSDEADVRFVQHMVGHLRQTTSITLLTRDHIHHPELAVVGLVGVTGDDHIHRRVEAVDDVDDGPRDAHTVIVGPGLDPAFVDQYRDGVHALGPELGNEGVHGLGLVLELQPGCCWPLACCRRPRPRWPPPVIPRSCGRRSASSRSAATSRNSKTSPTPTGHPRLRHAWL
jgi:hypothetical protein